jgi:hypothetical protein
VAEQALVVQERHGDLVDEQTRHEGAADHLTLLARGRVRQRRYREAREALEAAAGHRAPPLRDRALAAALAVPGLRAGLGRRPTYR